MLRALESPLRVVRQGSSRSNSARLRSSWQSVFQGNHHHRAHSLDRRHSARSHGSAGGGEGSFSFKRAAAATEVAPELAAALDEDAVVV